MLDKLEFLLSEAGQAIRRNGLMAFAAITTVAVSLFLIGALGYTYFRLALYAETLPDQFTMEVFIEDGSSDAAIRETGETIRAMPGVKTAIFVSKEAAWTKLEGELDLPGISADIENPLPDQFKVVLHDLKHGEEVVAQIAKLPTVMPDGVKYLPAEQRFVEQMLRLIRMLGTVVGGLLFATAGVLIYNAIRLTIISRRLEIRVMQLVGASRLTIRIPFLLEGIVHGSVGGCLAGLLLWLSHRILQEALLNFQAFGPLPAFPGWTMIGVLTGIGAIYGLFTSALALSAPLKYR